LDSASRTRQTFGASRANRNRVIARKNGPFRASDTECHLVTGALVQVQDQSTGERRAAALFVCRVASVRGKIEGQNTEKTNVFPDR
jgi:hypothetical protein